MGIFRSRHYVSGADRGGDATEGRNGWQGERYVLPVGNPRQVLAEEGSYFVCSNATIATELAGHAAPAIGEEATKPLLYVYNGSNEKFVLPDYVWLRTDTPNASATETYFAVTLTNEQSRDSGGTQLTPQNCRSDNPYSSQATVYFGAVVCTPSASRRVGQRQIRSVIQVAEDEYLFSFGAAQALASARVTTGTADVQTLSTFAPVVIAPGGEFLFTMICPTGAATAWDGEVEFGFIER